VNDCKPLLAGHGAPGGRAPGRAVQVDPIEPTLTAPGTVRLELEYDAPVSSFAFNFSLRRYTQEAVMPRIISGSTLVGRCRLTLSNPR